MNIAASTAQPATSSARPDPAGVSDRVALTVDGDGVDPLADPMAKRDGGFGRMLADRLTASGVGDVPSATDPTTVPAMAALPVGSPPFAIGTMVGPSIPVASSEPVAPSGPAAPTIAPIASTTQPFVRNVEPVEPGALATTDAATATRTMPMAPSAVVDPATIVPGTAPVVTRDLAGTQPTMTNVVASRATAVPLPAREASGAAVVAPPAGNVPHATGPVSGPVSVPVTGDARQRPSDEEDAAGDLAAQLALVAQWVVVPVPSTGGTAAPRSSGTTVAADAAGKPAPVRNAASVPGTGPANDLEVVDATRLVRPSPHTMTEAADDRASLPGALAALPSSGSLPDRATRPSGGSSGPSASVARARDAADAGTAALLPVIETQPGRIEPLTLPGTNDVATPATAFVTQLATRVGDVQAQAPAAPAVTTTLHQPVGTPAWTHEVGQATLRMAANDMQSASLRMNPEQLGPLDVQVRVDNGVAHLAFSAASAETRQALEASRPALDQMFADQGLKMGGCDIGDTSSRRSPDADMAQANGSRRDGSGTQWTDPSSTTSTTVVTTSIKRALGLVDTFA